MSAELSAATFAVLFPLLVLLVALLLEALERRLLAVVPATADTRPR
ncbi:MAG: hypothetical protein L0H84_07040 [Pseudonocardia sp.]|nr:hypothetical protein [Pseudonocardia sp.]